VGEDGRDWTRVVVVRGDQELEKIPAREWHPVKAQFTCYSVIGSR
jgi:hypothetical protein